MKSWVIVLFYSKFHSVAGCNLGWFPWGSLQWSPPWPRFKSHESCLLICMSFPESGSKDYRYTELLVIPLYKALKYFMYDFKRRKSILQLTSTVETTKYNKLAERKEGANQSWPLNLTIEFPYPLIFKRTVWQTCVLRFIFNHTWTNKQSVNSFKQNELAHLPSLRCKGDCEIFSGCGGGSTWANLFNWSWIGL